MPEVASSPRDPAQDARTRRAQQQQALLINSLMQSGQIAQDGTSSFTIATDQILLAARIYGSRPGYGMWGG